MTYNIRLDVASDGDNAWPNRKEFLSSQVLFLGPDVMGVQEALSHQIKDLNNLLKDYKLIGHGRDGGDNGEYSAIFYNSKKLNVETNGTFWLSPKPNQVSIGWDAALPRICTYGLFSQQNNLSKFWVFNTHFDHVGVEARKESVKLILNKISFLNKQNYPVIVMGDFNAEPNSEVIKEISNTMLDSKQIAALQFGANGTFNGFKYNEPISRRIDYIFVSKELKPNVQKYSVLSSIIDSRFPSDHFPVYTELILN
ncbi:endonuclease/exonuclease/phosphatase family protein [Winogradskyella litoriviva]|nr:endonuclease/exonuclease/phosphatase family protein [Winogradskyella litoriviva]